MCVRGCPSQCLTRTVKGIHLFTLENYSLCKGVGYGNPICSNTFTVAGYQWVVFFFLDGTPSEMVELSLKEKSVTNSRFSNLTLLDQSGQGNHLTVYPINDKQDMGPIVLNTGQQIGAPHLIICDLLEKSPYVRGDSIKIGCTLGILLQPKTEISTTSIIVPQLNEPGFHFLGMLETGEGSDVTFIVGARSSVFERILFSHMASDQTEMFIYSDTLPENEMSLVGGYEFGQSMLSIFGAKLLAAADMYDLRRLKNICKFHLWRSISLNRFAEILMIAERCNASLLKNLWFGFAVDHYADIKKLDTFADLEKNCPLLHKELIDYLSKERAVLHPKQIEEVLTLAVAD
ncbi:hypothetical protein ABFS82_13G039200 [Erythranthe guttata]